MVNGIIFDMDGTLVDSEISHPKMVLEMFEDYGEEIPLSVCLSQTGIVYERAVKVYYQYWNKSSFNDFQQIYCNIDWHGNEKLIIGKSFFHMCAKFFNYARSARLKR